MPRCSHLLVRTLSSLEQWLLLALSRNVFFVVCKRISILVLQRRMLVVRLMSCFFLVFLFCLPFFFYLPLNYFFCCFDCYHFSSFQKTIKNVVAITPKLIKKVNTIIIVLFKSLSFIFLLQIIVLLVLL